MLKDFDALTNVSGSYPLQVFDSLECLLCVADIQQSGRVVWAQPAVLEKASQTNCFKNGILPAPTTQMQSVAQDLSSWV